MDSLLPRVTALRAILGISKPRELRIKLEPLEKNLIKFISGIKKKVDVNTELMGSLVGAKLEPSEGLVELNLPRKSESRFTE